jgi:hypothetical protein
MNTNTESVVNYRFHTNIKDSPMPGSFSVVSFFCFCSGFFFQVQHSIPQFD